MLTKGCGNQQGGHLASEVATAKSMCIYIYIHIFHGSTKHVWKRKCRGPAFGHLLQVVAAILKCSRGRGYFSKFTCADGIQMFYDQCNLWPEGIHAGLPSIHEWKARMGLAAARLDAWQLKGFVVLSLEQCLVPETSGS